MWQDPKLQMFFPIREAKNFPDLDADINLMSLKTGFLPMSSKRSTQTTNTLVSGPSGGKDFPLDELFVFASGVNCIENVITHHIRILKENVCHYIFRLDKDPGMDQTLPF